MFERITFDVFPRWYRRGIQYQEMYGGRGGGVEDDKVEKIHKVNA